MSQNANKVLSVSEPADSTHETSKDTDATAAIFGKAIDLKYVSKRT